MKKSLPVLILSLVLSLSHSWAQNPSAIVVFSENGEKFILAVDGVAINTEPLSNVRADNLNGDFFQLLVDFEDDALGKVSQGFMLDPGQEQKARIQMKKNGSYAIRPFGEPTAYSPLSRNAEPAAVPPSEMYFEEDKPVSSSSQTTVVKTTSSSETMGSGDQVDINIDMMGTKMGVSVKVEENGMAMDQEFETTETVETTTTTQFETKGSPETEEIVDACAPMAGGDFNDVLSSLKSKSFADSQMTQVKQVIKNNCMSADQIKEVMKVFKFEDDRLEFAKTAYDRCSDPRNYWKINDAFEFELTIEELNEFIEAK